VRIRFHKISDERHTLEIIRSDGRREEVECETKSYLEHDLLHYALESEARLQSGFWGKLANGSTLERVNDQKAPLPPGARETEELAAIEQIVGALHGGSRGPPVAEFVAGMRRFAEALGAASPGWVSEELIGRVREAMRRLEGHWRATRHGDVMELAWPN